MLRKVKYCTFFIILLLIFASCGAPATNYDLNPAQKALITKNYENFKHQTLHVDSEFTKEEMDMIFNGSKDWETATLGMIKSTFFWYEKLPDRDVHDNINKNIVMKFHSSHPFVYYQDRLKDANVIGFVHWVGDHYYLGIVTDRIGSKGQFTGVVLHEIGHTLGLDHYDTNFAIMNTQVGAAHDCLTFSDLDLFCDKFKCSSKDMAFCKK